MKITKEYLKQIIKEELKESVIDKEYDRPMTAGDVLSSLQDAVGRHGSGPEMAQALRDIADQIERSSNPLLASTGPGSRGNAKEVSDEELEEFNSAGTGTYGVERVHLDEVARAYAADFLKEHRILGMYRNNIYFEDSSGKVYKMLRSTA